jgi:hypothetical protein
MGDPETVGASDRAVIGSISMDGASYWRFDRLRLHGQNNIDYGSDHNIFNRLMIYRMPNPEYHGIRFRQSDNNTVQRSLIARHESASQMCSSDVDEIGITLRRSSDIRIVQNEMFDFWCGDHVQVTYQGEMTGNIVAGNDLYETDWIHNHRDDESNDMAQKYNVENVLDYKNAPTTSDVPEEDKIRIVNNRIWNFRQNAIIINNPDLNGFVIENNTAWVSRTDSNLDQSTFLSYIDPIQGDVTLKSNRIIGWQNGATRLSGNMVEDANWRSNLVVDASPAIGSTGYPEITAEKNVFVESDISRPPDSTGDSEISQNAFYSSSDFGTGDPDSIYRSDASEANLGDLTVTVKQITGPEQVTIQDAKTTSESPHAEWFN